MEKQRQSEITKGQIHLENERGIAIWTQREHYNSKLKGNVTIGAEGTPNIRNSNIKKQRDYTTHGKLKWKWNKTSELK